MQAKEDTITEEVKNCNQEKEMIINFGKIVASQKIDSQWPNVALQTQAVMMACVESMNQDGKKVAVTPVSYEEL